MADWRAHYDAIYSTMGVEADLDVGVTDPVDIVVMDKTRGVTVHEGAGNVSVETVRPAADARMYDLISKGVQPADLRNGTLSFNGRDWRIMYHIMRPAPTGEDEGEVRMILLQQSATP